MGLAPSGNGEDPGKSAVAKLQGPRSGMAAIMGRWPGDETEKEIHEALECIS
jgi:hypothetical protein